MKLKYFLHGYSNINWAMVSKEEGIMSVLYNRVQKEEVRLFGLIVNYPFIDTLSPRGTFYGPK